MNNLTTNIWLLIALAAGIAILLIYVILPRIIRNYSAEKAVKLLLIYIMMGYLSYDFWLKEKYLFVAIFVLGAGLYTYLTVIAKRK